MFFSRRGDQHASVTWPTRVARGHRPVLRRLFDRVAVELDPDELARHALAPDPLERVLADVVGFLLLDQALQASDLERVGLEAEVRAPVEDAGLHASDVRRRRDADAVRLAGVEDPLPQVVAAAGVAQVDLVADDGRPSRSADHDGDAVQVGLVAPVVLHVEDPVAEQVAHRVLGLRALHLHRVDLGVPDVHVHTRVHCGAHRVQARVGVRQCEPPPVLFDAQQHGVVHDAAVRGGDEYVLALLHRARREVSARQQVRERARVRPGDLDDTLDAHVPERHVVDERPVLIDGIAVRVRVVHVLIDVVRGASRAQRRLEVR